MRTTRRQLWIRSLALVAYTLVALLPANGVTICLHDEHVGFGTTGAACPCDASEHPEPSEDHVDLEVDPVDGTPSDHQDVFAHHVAVECAPSPAADFVDTCIARLEPRARGPTEPGWLRSLRTVVLVV